MYTQPFFTAILHAAICRPPSEYRISAPSGKRSLCPSVQIVEEGSSSVAGPPFAAEKHVPSAPGC
eukprot:3936950-Rhodomonas_salina.1